MAPIRPLPAQTIDRIAAGEVIQRPSAIIKELIENSLDASSTSIDVSAKGLDVSVSDNGCGIEKNSLKLACTRFATSKIVDFDDLRSVKTFGFRGEALASCSMVGRVTITSRRSGDKCAYKMNFRDGVPDNVNCAAGQEVEPKPCAGKDGTTIQVQDLFYNVPSRRKAMEGRRNEREEYDRILSVVQRYAVHEARRGVGFLCRGGGKGGKQCDLNTQSLGSVKRVIEKRRKDGSLSEKGFGDEEVAAVKDVIAHVFGSDVTRELLPLTAGEGDVNAVGLEALKAMAELGSENLQDDSEQTENSTKSVEESNRLLLEEMMMSVADSQIDNKSKGTKSSDASDAVQASTTNSNKFSFAYKATGLITNGSYSAPKSAAAFLLFINDRLVESPSLRRAVESIYADTLPKGGKPFVYLSLELPGPHVDVNVHPTKKEVALLHEDRLCDALMAAVREVIGSATSSRTFVVVASSLLRRDREKIQSVLVKKQDVADANGKQTIQNENGDSESDEMMDENEDTPSIKPKRQLDSGASIKPPTAKKPYDPSRLVRTNRAALAGALEPFLVKKNTNSDDDSTEKMRPIRHEPECPLAGQSTPDMNMPGAFAKAICRCQIHRGENLPPIANGVTVRSNQTNIVRPKKVTPTECEYDSIIELRTDVSSRNHQSLNETLRGSSYVGAISRSRSLIQSGIDLLMINHRELAREMFYQLALLKFGGMATAQLGGGGVHCMTIIGDYLQSLETEDLGDTSKLKISKTNTSIARQAVSCLAEKAPMLQDYFSIRFERRSLNEQSNKESLWLTGLPIMLDGHSPQPYALPLFLLRLATKVDWTAEKPCFQGICKELASYYSELPLADADESSTNDDPTNQKIVLIEDEAKLYVQHTLYPVISHLLIPPKEFASNGTVIKLANLTSLYKVFERC
jgi:DNA mismatch repair protein MLH1